MRIIVTKLGEEVVKVLNEEKLVLEENILKKKKKNRNKQIHTEIHTTPNTKEIKISPQKIFIPKNIAERYNNRERESSTNILPTININNSNSEPLNNINTDRKSVGKTINSFYLQYGKVDNTRMKESFRLKEIIPYETQSMIRHNIKKNMKIRNLSNLITSDNFRSSYRYDRLYNLNNNIERKEIKAESVNLIRYLHNKSDLSDVFINKIVSYDSDQMSKLNKVCMKIFQNSDKEELLKKRINEVIMNQRVKEGIQYKNSLDYLKSKVDDIQNILGYHKKKVSDKERYIDIHNEKEKLWNKNNLTRYFHKTKNNFEETNDKIKLTTIESSVNSLKS